MLGLSKMSLKAKLLIPISIITLLVVLIMSGVAGVRAYRASKADAIEKTMHLSHGGANFIKLEVERALIVARGLSNVMEANIKSGQTSRKDLVDLMKHTLTENSELIGTGVGFEPNAWDGKDSEFVDTPAHDKTGRFIPYVARKSDGTFDHSALVDYEVPGVGDYYVIPKKIKNEFITDPYFYPVDGKQVLMTSPVVPILVNGEFKGIAAVDMSLSVIAERVSELKPFPDSEAFLVTSTGLYLTHSNTEMITKPVEFSFAQEELLSAVKEGRESEVTGFVDGKEYTYTITPIKIGKHEGSWSLVFKTPVSSITARANSLIWGQIVIGLLSLIVMILAVWWIAVKLSQSVEESSNTIHKAGDMVAGAIEQLSNAGRNLSQSSSASAASLEETVASLEEMTSMVSMNTQNAAQAADLSSQASKLATEGEVEMDKLLASMSNISDSSKKIEEIISVIDDIAFQTNLLALNASVEAARAGEHGKGFAVVADAVRTLAQRAATAAKDIATLIRDSVEMVDDGRNKADTSGARLRDIVEAIKKISTLNGEIAAASQEQTVGIQQISKAMNQLDESVQSNAASSEEIASTAEEINRQAQMMRESSEVLIEMVKGRQG